MTAQATSEEYRRLGPPLGPEAAGHRTDRFLARTFPFHSRNQWSDLCWQGALLVNGRPVRPSHRLAAGDRLAVHHPLSAEPEVDDRIELIAEASGVIAVYKPGNLPMHESGDFRRRTFAAALSAAFGPEWAPVHRLDRETSGVLICAATPAMRAALSRAWEKGDVEKAYLAIAAGRVAWDCETADAPLAPIEDGGRPRYQVDPRGLPAITEFRVLERAAGTTLMAIRPRTGRTNQIRVHAAWLGHPLVGDKIYHADPRVFARFSTDGDSPAVRRLAGFPRHALHAAGIRLIHPETKQPFEVTSALPEDLAGYWANQLRVPEVRVRAPACDLPGSRAGASAAQTHLR